MLFLLHFLSLSAIGVQSYNLDVQNFQLFEDPQANNSGRASYFGYSVALYALGSDSVLLVGAPRANSTTPSGSIEPGAVYSCHLASHGSCTEWPVDMSSEAPIFGQTSNMKSRNHAWLGATISVQNTTKPKVAVCAPRRTNIRMVFSKEMGFMNGMCYSVTANNSSSFTHPATRKHTPISNDLNMQITELNKGRHKGKLVHYHGMGQVGFSLHQTPDIHGDFILGAPGFYHSTGTTIFIDERDQRDSKKAIIPNVIDDPYLEFDDYLGYSITSGRFYKLSERLYASSAPRSANNLGKVFIHSFPSRYASRFAFRKIIEGEQYGEYFGASLTSCDVNCDGRDDLIIGAPLWSKQSDEGRVYVYKSKDQVEFEVQKIEGEYEGGRFGTVVSCLNDLDFDGYADVAVGAPYEDNGRGAVYIFNGSPEGLSVQPSQRIGAVDLSTNLRGLGISISEPRDVDGNRFPDVAFGAYSSGHAVLLRSRPIVTLNMKLIKSQNFTLMQNATYFVVDVCTFYDGPFAPASFDVTKTLTIDEVHKRAIVYQNGKLFGNIYRVIDTLKKGEEKCASIKINLKKNVQNVIDPIEIMGNVTLHEGSRNCSHCSVVNPRLSKISDNLKLAYILDCGEDDVCNADLQVNITSALNDENCFIIGSNSTHNITILVENTEEPAYKTQAHVYIPLPITLARVPPECDEILEVNRTLEVICSLGNPLRLNNTITMELDMRAIKYHEESSVIQVAVTTQSEEEHSSNNLATLNINYSIDAHITIAGKTDGHLYSFEEQDVIGKNSKTVSINQIYEIWKIGVTPIHETVVIINVPTQWKEKEIAKIRRVRISIDGQFQDCDVLLDEESNSTLYEIHMESDAERNSTLTIPSEERTFFINCTTQHTTCRKFECQLGPLLKAQSLATLTMTIDFQLPNATEEEYKSKDIIYFVSEGFVKVSNWNLSEKLMNDLIDHELLATSFFIRHKPEQVAMWIIIVSVLLGIILIVVLALLLIKLGFFNRKRKEDLNVLRSTHHLTVVDED